ncbi:MAG: flagellin [Planctomycetota bacterium]
MTSLDPTPALTAQRFLAINQRNVDTELRRIATGLFINSGADDPAGLIAAENLSKEIRQAEAEARAAERNDAIANIAEGALAEVSNLLVEAEGLAVSSANTGGLSDAEIAANQQQFDSIVGSIDRIFSSARFNGQRLFSGNFDIPAATSDGTGMTLPELSIGDFGSTQISDGSGGTVTRRLIDVSTSAVELGSPDAQSIIDTASSTINSLRGEIGSFQANTLNTISNSTLVRLENQTAARSIIQDTDYAASMVNLTTYDITGRATMAALGSINERLGQVVSLVG